MEEFLSRWLGIFLSVLPFVTCSIILMTIAVPILTLLLLFLLLLLRDSAEKRQRKCSVNWKLFLGEGNNLNAHGGKGTTVQSLQLLLCTEWLSLDEEVVRWWVGVWEGSACKYL